MAIFVGVIIVYGSYNTFGKNGFRCDSLIIFISILCLYNFRVATTVAIVDTITSALSGIIVFGILGNLAYEPNIKDVSKVVQGGLGLAFVSNPDAISKFVFIPQLFSAAFFFMLFVIGVGCIVGLQVCLMSVSQDFQTVLIIFLGTVQFCCGLVYITGVRFTVHHSIVYYY